MDDYLGQLEKTENLDAEVIKKTKVHKVLKAIVKLNTSIPKEEQYDFKGRSSKLLQKWTSILSADGEAGEAAVPTSEPTTNGVNGAKSEPPVAEDKAETAADTIEVAKAPEVDGDVPMTDAKTDEPAAKVDTAPLSATPAVDTAVETTP